MARIEHDTIRRHREQRRQGPAVEVHGPKRLAASKRNREVAIASKALQLMGRGGRRAGECLLDAIETARP